LEMFSGWTQSFDSVSLFLSECVDFEPRKKVLRAGLYAAYKKFCEESNYFPKKKGGFFDEIRKIRNLEEKLFEGKMYFRGLALVLN
jgi:phage/plasmid-associated DNA primase